jgi:hypothetical protein
MRVGRKDGVDRYVDRKREKGKAVVRLTHRTVVAIGFVIVAWLWAMDRDYRDIHLGVAIEAGAQHASR